ncbi:hypothetical protein ACOMHN_023312 [Nucella lapillus]
MINLEFLLGLQIDLLDMPSQPDGKFKWILHARDHFTKFSWLYPMKTKMAAEVADHLITQFCVFRSPRIMQSDNGKEFTAQVINDLTLLWTSMVIIHRRPRHPDSQGCVECGNGDMEGKWMETHEQEWSRGLKFIAHAINTSVSSTTGKSPYHLGFGQRPCSDCTVWEELARQGIIDEEDLPENIMCLLNPGSSAVSSVVRPPEDHQQTLLWCHNFCGAASQIISRLFCGAANFCGAASGSFDFFGAASRCFDFCGAASRAAAS